VEGVSVGLCMLVCLQNLIAFLYVHAYPAYRY
jgi:hypothetical protein